MFVPNGPEGEDFKKPLVANQPTSVLPCMMPIGNSRTSSPTPFLPLNLCCVVLHAWVGSINVDLYINVEL